MRLIAAISTLATLALAAWAGHALWQEISHPPQQIRPLASLSEDPTAPSAPAATPPRRWPALFGERQPPKPQPPKPPEPKGEPQPPRPPKPPIDSLGYRLKGMVQAGEATWAMVSHPTGEQLVRRGDPLGQNMTVVRIDAEGLWVSRDGDAPELLGFPE